MQPKSPKLVLVLAPNRWLTGRMVGPEGTGVSGAAVDLHVGLPVPKGQRVATDLEGRFEVYLYQPPRGRRSRRRLGLPFEKPAGTATEVRTYPGLSGGVYSALYLDGPTWALADALCAGTLNEAGAWSFLAEGGMAILDLDSKRVQKAEPEGH